MRREIFESTTIKEIRNEIIKLEQTIGTFYLNDAKISVRISPKRQK